MCIDAVGFRYTKSEISLNKISTNDSHVYSSLFILGFVHKLQRAVFLETDTPEILDEAITIVRKGGTVAIVGD